MKRFVAQGSGGEVWADGGLACKVPHSGVDNLKEAEVLMHLCGHPNVIALCSVGRRLSPERMVIHMPLLHSSLARWLKLVGGAASSGVLRSQCVQLLSAAAHLHSRRVLHNDIKPENVLVGDSSGHRVVLADMDLACILPADTVQPQLGIVHTAHYRDPATFQGRFPVFPHADTWCMGLVLWNIMARGCHMFDCSGLSIDDVVQQESLMLSRQAEVLDQPQICCFGTTAVVNNTALHTDDMREWTTGRSARLYHSSASGAWQLFLPGRHLINPGPCSMYPPRRGWRAGLGRRRLNRAHGQPADRIADLIEDMVRLVPSERRLPQDSLRLAQELLRP